MTFRIAGTLKSWNDEKGFGFITPVNGGQDIFVHITDYPRRGGLPKEGEALSFEVTLNKDGKKKAVKVQRPGTSSPNSPNSYRSRPAGQSERKSSGIGKAITTLVLIVALAVGYKFLAPRFSAVPSDPIALADSAEASTPSATFQCDGRKHCSQMTSCAEAKYFLQNCPNTEMDGDGDGVPCESQWCTSPIAK
ncbi:MAG: DNA-binding protein [Betaproteobacteria bacterium HGW-Betaproteobacteria-12]|nr:MAG: DNA-binding protein [Betaproteobacteria bacterium HGW-Betaproteobacteria-12]